MRDLAIAYGNSCMAKTWSNKTITFDELCERLKVTVRTPETVEEYPKLPKAERDRIKDKGGFVGGQLKDNRRKRETVVSRSMLTLDVDRAEVGFADRFTMECKYAGVLYSTHGNTPEAPRCRMIIPLTRDVSSDEYVAIARFYASEWGIDMFDECSYRPHQLMYWPTTPSNGEYIFERLDGPWLDPDVYLAAHPGWKDISLLPTSSRESMIHKAGRRQEDPLTKKGVVGAFCRTYTIQAAIEKYLSDVYETSTVPGRYDYIPADSSAGVVIYDDKFAYSHHATDPACGKEMNAFDLVRIHKFGDDDPNAAFKAMTELATADEDVRLLIVRERFADSGSEQENDEWKKNLEVDKSGKIKDSLDNLVLILRYDENLKNIAFNLHRDGIDARGGVPWEQLKDGWSDSDNSALKVYLSSHYGIYSPNKTKDAVVSVAAERSYHPVKEYLEGLPEWDGVPRVDTLLIDYFGATDTVYTRAVIRKTMVAAVARIYQPMIKFDSVLILNGPQGIGKSTFFAKLGGNWFSDSLTLTDMKDKSGPEKLQGYWILELGELAGMRKTDVETVKSFISRTDDKYRASYGVSVESHPRQCIIVGSTNAESGFLRDITGNRRFWPVRVDGSGPKKAWQLNAEIISQIWAETLVLYHQGEKLYLEGEEAAAAKNEQADAMETDDREGLVRAYLEKELPDNWREMDLFERRSFLEGTSIASVAASQKTYVRGVVCNMEIWCECFGKDKSAIKKSDSYEISAILQKIGGWQKYTGAKNGAYTFPIYGKQKAYERIKGNEQGAGSEPSKDVGSGDLDK